MRRGLLLAGVGTLAGLVGAALGARLMQSLLYGITAADPTSYAAAAALILTVVLAASWLPVRRAIQIDPARALRVD
jgi:putative ABC transport system permease protein